MKPRECIVAATDLSAPARHAVKRAVRLAARTRGELHVLHALELDALDSLRDLLGADLSATKAALEAEARQRLERLVADHARHPDTAALARIVTGAPLAVLAREIEALDAGLVVLGARGDSFLRHATLGSTAARLLRKAVRCPVLVVKQVPHDDYRTVLVAVDFSPAAALAIRAARRWAPGAELVLLHAFELPFEGKLSFAGVDERTIRRYVRSGVETRRDQLHALARSAGLKSADYSARVVRGDPAQQIIAMEQEYDVDLIAVGKHGTHLAEEMLLGSVTKHVLAEAQGDVMVVVDSRVAQDAQVPAA
ncbi:MAG: universal stress protein [Burkholderiales bacterium]|nr:universal stress protein [Burkholderiales bacterium]